MDNSEIIGQLNKLKAERDKQNDKVQKLTETVNAGRARLAREQAKLTQLEEKIASQEFFIFKKRFKDVGVEGDAGIEEVIAVYQDYKKRTGE